jgi:hypothetical protein
MKRAIVALVVAVLGAAPGSPARAADWPTRPIRIIAPSTPGGAADMFGRLLCDHFGETFRERCFVENRAGAGGLIGTAATAQAAPDGYTLTTSSTAYHVIAPAVSANPGFDPIKDFTHIAYIGGPPNVFVVNPALGVRSLGELVALGRRGQPIDYVSPGVGTLGHLLMESLAHKAGIKVQQIMTKGASRALIDLVAGTVNVGTMTWTIGARTDPLRQARADRGVVERAAQGISRSADLQGAGLRGAHGGVVVRAVGTGRSAERHHAPPQRGRRRDAGAARGEEAPRPRRHRDPRHEPGGIHRLRGERDRQMGAGRQAGDDQESVVRREVSCARDWA